MKKCFVIVIALLSSMITHSQNLSFVFNQGGYYWEGKSTSDSYVLGSGNVVCTFNASFSNDPYGNLIMSVYNPSRQGFVPATYYIHPDYTFDIFVNGQFFAKGVWSPIQPKRGPSSKGKHCTYIVGCDCPGFKAKGSYGSDKYTCKHCGHDKQYHH